MTGPVPFVSWCRARMRSIWVIHSSEYLRNFGSSLRFAPGSVDLGVDIGRRAGDHVDAGLLRHVEQLVDVAHAGEVVDARRRRVVAPVEIDRCRVEPSRLHLLEDVEPQIRARQAEIVELSGPDVGPLAVDYERVAVEADGVRRTGGQRGRARGG